MATLTARQNAAGILSPKAWEWFKSETRPLRIGDMPATDPTPVLACFSSLGLFQRVQCLDMAGGWSGSLLWRVTTAAGRVLCLRRWPLAHPTPDRLRLIHAVLTHVGS